MNICAICLCVDPIFRTIVYFQTDSIAFSYILRWRSEACRREAIYSGDSFVGINCVGKFVEIFTGQAYRNCFLVTDVSRVTNPIAHRRLPWPAYDRSPSPPPRCLSTNFQQLNPDRQLNSRLAAVGSAIRESRNECFLSIDFRSKISHKSCARALVQKL